ncbi:glycosyltransferase family 4 protein [Pseudovibrio sp. SPO723]|uniref:glycosyltransferase family 4 protein n=1 Tax=Nesiotobacter zosterae TaxID=392721 RepID=UPI0029C2307F|nr:glycosyltransferase family 4 protein [Pseudovibrio sp. SPO723]MDX5594973.1 glycosyltransferase family 4 protein [Pseudovibrio sp. SPO723]
MKVNFVITRDLGSKIFADLFRRFARDGRFDLAISEKALPGADIYHFHRPQLEEHLPARSVVTVHHDLEDSDPFVSFDRFESKYRQAERIICLNTGQAEFLAQHGMHHTVVVPHGYDPKLFSKKPLRTYKTGEPLKLGFISRRYGRRVKGEVLLEEIFQTLPPGSAEFYLIGEGRSQDAALLESFGFSCRCYEFLPYQLFPEVYKEIDFLLMLSAHEGGPANIPEAIASGTPVLTTPVGLTRDLIVDGENGLFLSGDFKQDRETLLKVMNNENGIFDRLTQGAHMSNKAITWNEVISRHIDIYRTVSGIASAGEPKELANSTT